MFMKLLKVVYEMHGEQLLPQCLEQLRTTPATLALTQSGTQ
jgi:hypothetical protein